MASPTSTAPGDGKLSTGTLVPTAGETKAGFPPFDPATFSSQLIWLAITFGALYYVLSRIALPRIGEVIEERRDRIQRDLDEAERLKSETEKALAAYEASLAEARGRAQGIAKENRDRLTADVERKRLEVEAENTRKLEDAERRIAETKARALAQVSEIASETAGSVVERLLGESVGPDEVRRAVGASG
jgi:F-type H+-transporting ATPase subunit b